MPPPSAERRRTAGPDDFGRRAAASGSAAAEPVRDAAAADTMRLVGHLPAALAELPPFYLCDATGQLLYANPACHRLIAELQDGHPEREPRMLFDLDDIISEIAASGEKVVRQFSFDVTKELHLRAEHAGLFDPAGTLLGVTVALRDVSELAGLRDRMSVTNERLDDITRLTSDWIWEVDPQLVLIFVSPRVSEVLGRQPIELVGRPLLEFGSFVGEDPATPPLDPPRRAPFRDLPFTMLHRDGTSRLFHLSALPVFGAGAGDFLGFRGTARDLTEHTDALHRAAWSQTQLTQALESISEGFALFDPDDRLVLCNHKFRNNFPAVADRILPGMNFEDFIRAGTVAGDLSIPESEREAWITERLRRRKEQRVSFELKLGDGRWIKVSDHKTADGSTVGIRTDITDLKLREEALYAAKETAEIASRSKSEFLANISHELRTPLNAIIGFSEIMREEIFGPLGSPQYREYIGDVLESAHHLLGVINDILDVAKAEAGKLELSEEHVEIAQVVNSARRLVQERAQRSRVTIRTNLPSDLPPLHADERKLKQILLNLLTNSVKFTPAGGFIEIAARLAETGDFLLTVRDTGIGIATEDIATALAPFGQVDSKLNRKYEGTGLGLPLSNAMVKLHGGELTIESAVGTGTTVTIRLPAARVRASV